jgi:hypothetical protein
LNDRENAEGDRDTGETGDWMGLHLAYIRVCGCGVLGGIG